MASPYANLVATYGQSWHRPWLALLLFVAALGAVYALTYEEMNEQVICTPIPGSRFKAAVYEDGLYWTGDIEAALACAREHDRRVLIAIHAVADANCRINEHRVFAKAHVKAAMRRDVLVKLHIDAVPSEYYVTTPDLQKSIEDGEANRGFEIANFDTLQEPLYAVVEPDAVKKLSIVGTHDVGIIRDPEEFISFLRDPQKTPTTGFWRNLTRRIRHLAKM